MLCSYGCGKEAIYQFKNGKWCCCKSASSCLEVRDRRRKSLLGRKRPIEVRKKISKSKKGHIPWNKGKTGVYSKETLKKISKSSKGRKHRRSKNYKARISIDQINNRYLLFSKIEEMRYNPYKPLREKEIQVHCKYNECKNSKEKGGWFTPSRSQLAERIRQLEDKNGNGGSYFYCSEKCKDRCILFNLYSDPLKENKRLYTQEEYETFRQFVLERDDHKCQYCNEPATIIHHERPQKLEPLFVLDPDFAWSCCEECHYKYGHKTRTECSTGNLASKVCN